MRVLRRNVLVFHSAALGDFIVTWPLALALGRVFPQSRIIYVTAASKGALAEKMLGVESTDVEAGWHALFSENRSLPEAATRRLAGAHTIISFVSKPDDVWTRNVRKIAPEADILHLWTKPADPDAVHVTEQLSRQLAGSQVIRAAHDQLLKSVADRGLAFHRPAPTTGFVIHPGSGSPTKNWPLSRFIELAEQLTNVRMILGEAELERLSAHDIHDLEQVATIIRPTTYLGLLSEILAARTFIGNDSGPAHLAGICGVRTVAIFGHPPPNAWKPLGPNVTVVSAAQIEDVTVEAVRAALP